MAHAWRVAFLVLVLPGALFIPSTPVSAASFGGSTATGIQGDFRDMALDSSRGRLYVSDASTFHAQGVVVMDVATRQEVARLDVSNPSGLALSPSGQRLAVGSFDAFIRVYDADTLQEIGTIPVQGDGYSQGYVWDLAFDGEDHLFMTLGQPYTIVGGTHSAYVYNLTTMTAVGGMSEGIDGFYAFSTLRIDAARRRAYVIDSVIPSRVWIYDITDVSSIQRIQRWDVGFDGDTILSPDGTRFYTVYGDVYDASSLALLGNTGDTGFPGLDAARGYVYYASGPRVDRVSSSTYARLARYAFRGNVAWIDRLTAFVVDPARDQAYVMNGIANNYDSLHVIRFVSGIVDPFPPDGGLVPSAPYAISAILSGNVDSASVTMEVNGATVSTVYDASWFSVAYVPPSALLDGDYHVLMAGLAPGNQVVQLEWNFTVDTKPPEIILEDAGTAFRTTQVTIHGRIVDAHPGNPGNASANGEPLALSPVDGSFAVAMNLTEGANILYILARDALRNENFSVSPILYVPPTTRYVDADARFSLEYPSAWSVEKDLVVNDVRLEVSIRRNATGDLSPNLNVIRTGPLSAYSNSTLLNLAGAVLTNLSALPGFARYTSPQVVSHPGGLAVTYSFVWNAANGWVYQRQYILANSTLGESWVLTFTSSEEEWGRYDSLFVWMASSFRTESTSEIRQGPVPMYVLIAGGAIAGAVAAGVAWFLLRRRAVRPTVPGGPAAPSSPAPGTREPPAQGELPPGLPPRPPSG